MVNSNLKGGDTIFSKIVISLILINFSLTAFVNEAFSFGFFFLLLIIPIIRTNKQTSSQDTIIEEDYSKLLKKAEKLRKNKRIKAAEKSYWQAIKAGEKSPDWQTNGPQAKPYKKLAKLYYHTKRDNQAVEVLNRYLKLARRHNLQTNRVEKLKRRLASGNFRRLINKYS